MAAVWGDLWVDVGLQLLLQLLWCSACPSVRPAASGPTASLRVKHSSERTLREDGTSPGSPHKDHSLHQEGTVVSSTLPGPSPGLLGAFPASMFLLTTLSTCSLVCVTCLFHLSNCQF